MNNVLFPAGNFEVSTVVLFKNVGQEEKYSGEPLIIEDLTELQRPERPIH